MNDIVTQERSCAQLETALDMIPLKGISRLRESIPPQKNLGTYKIYCIFFFKWCVRNMATCRL